MLANHEFLVIASPKEGWEDIITHKVISYVITLTMMDEHLCLLCYLFFQFNSDYYKFHQVQKASSMNQAYTSWSLFSDRIAQNIPFWDIVVCVNHTTYKVW